MTRSRSLGYKGKASGPFVDRGGLAVPPNVIKDHLGHRSLKYGSVQHTSLSTHTAAIYTTLEMSQSIDLNSNMASLQFNNNSNNDGEGGASTRHNGNLSKRGLENGEFITPAFEKILKLFGDLYDPETNPKGTVQMGVADNSLCRKELLEVSARVGSGMAVRAVRRARSWCERLGGDEVAKGQRGFGE